MPLLKAIIECPICKKEFECDNIYEKIECPFCGAEIKPLPEGEEYWADIRHFV
jgi:uncharacterized CHY-type Zn-finger protein